MSQSRNLTRDMNNIETLYESVVEETFKHEEVSHAKKDIVPLVKNTGPEAADNFKTSKVDTEDLSDKEEKENQYEPRKFSQNSGKVVQETINNSVMSTENIFDKLYKTVMEGEEVQEGMHGMYEDDEDVTDAASTGAEETVSVNLSPMHVEALLDLLAQVEDQLGDEYGDDEPEGLEDMDDDLVAEAPAHTEVAPDGVAKLTGKDNKVGNHKVAGGSADSGEAGGGEGKPEGAPDGVAKLTGKDNKVGSQKEFGA